jgi:hypothetical protein
MSSASQMSDGYQTSRTVSYAGSIQSAQSFTWNEALEPLDYEDVMNEHATASDRDPLKLLLSFPLDDLQLHLLPRPWRTLQPITPPEPLYMTKHDIRNKTKSELMNYIFQGIIELSCTRLCSLLYFTMACCSA